MTKNTVLFELEPSKELNTSIAMHFARSNQFEIAKLFMKEAEVKNGAEWAKKFELLHDILEGIRASDLNLAIQWASSNRDELQARGSDLEFVLQQTQFVLILLQEGPSLALIYARQHLPSFGERYFKGKTSKIPSGANELQTFHASCVPCFTTKVPTPSMKTFTKYRLSNPFLRHSLLSIVSP